jgi:cation transport ATPase
MRVFLFHTNIKCAACRQQVAQTFNRERNIISFKVNLEDPNRPLEVSTSDGITEREVQALVEEAGYQAVPQRESGGFFQSLFSR